MNSIDELAEFFGWCTVVNTGFLIAATALLVLMRGPISRIHARMFGLSQEDISRAYFQYLAQYKIAVLVFSLVPYIALKMMS